MNSGRLRAVDSSELGPCKRVAAAATAAKMESGGSEEAAQDPGGAWYQASDVQAEPAEAVGLIGSRIRVWWTGEKAWYAGRVTSVGRGASGSLHTIAYDDGAQATHYLQSAESALNETWEPEEPSPECKTPAKAAAAPKLPSSGPRKPEEERLCLDWGRCGTFGCTLRDRHMGLHAFTVDVVRSHSTA